MEKKRRIYTPHRLTPVQRTAISLDSEHLCVILCGSLPTMMAYLLVRDDVLLYAVRTSAELKETLLDEGGIPADLVFVEAHRLSDLPQMSFSHRQTTMRVRWYSRPTFSRMTGRSAGSMRWLTGCWKRNGSRQKKYGNFLRKKTGTAKFP